MMTPEDFLRSITPGLQQPEQLGLDQFTNISLEELNHLSPQLGVDESSIFYQLGSGSHFYLRSRSQGIRLMKGTDLT